MHSLDILNVEEAEWDQWVHSLEILNVEAHDWEQWTAEDDVKGVWLPPESVYSARLRELSYLKQRQVYSYSTVEEAKKVTGRRPLPP